MVRPVGKAFGGGGLSKDVLCDILPYAPGSSIQKEPETLRWQRCNSNHITEINIRVTDKDNREIRITEPYSMTIAFKSF